MAACTGVGARDHNEDDLRFAVGDVAAYAVLSDGAGGHDNGATASDLVVRMVTLRLQTAGEVSVGSLDRAVREAHELLAGEARAGESARHRMHATLVVVWIDVRAGVALWSHVGDSRLYVLRGGAVCQVTRDDSAVQQLVDAGLIEAAAAPTHPMKHQLLSAMGVAAGFAAHTLHSPYALADGDALLLCTDGWWESVRPADIERTLTGAQAPAQWLQAMQALIEAAANPRQDNYSAIAVWVGTSPVATFAGLN